MTKKSVTDRQTEYKWRMVTNNQSNQVYAPFSALLTKTT